MRAGRLNVRDAQYFEASDQRLIGSKYGEVASCCDGSDEDVCGSALDATVEAHVVKSGCLDVVHRNDPLVQKRIQQLLNL